MFRWPDRHRSSEFSEPRHYLRHRHCSPSLGLCCQSNSMTADIMLPRGMSTGFLILYTYFIHMLAYHTFNLLLFLKYDLCVCVCVCTCVLGFEMDIRKGNFVLDYNVILLRWSLIKKIRIISFILISKSFNYFLLLFLSKELIVDFYSDSVWTIIFFDIVLLRLILQGHLNHYVTPHCVITNPVPGENN